MKALSIRQPWAWLIANGHKDIENRSWGTSFRGPVFVHAGKAFDPDVRPGVDEMNGVRLPARADLARGAIVGVATVVDCVETHRSDWFYGPYGFVLTNAKPLLPVPCRGQLGLFDVPADVAEQLRALAARGT